MATDSKELDVSGYSTTELAKAIDSREGQWTSRDACLQQLSHRFRSSSLDAFSPEFKRILQGITAQLSDLRSQVVRSACTALSDMATAARDHVVLERPMREQLLPELLRLAGNGNTVLAGAARECLPVLFHNCHFEGMLKVICATLKESRHGAVRNLCCVAALSAIRTWPVHILESCAPLLESSLMVAATAAAVEVRSLARQCLAEYQHAFPAREEAIGCSLDSNLRGLLRQQSEEILRQQAGEAAPPSPPRHVLCRNRRRGAPNSPLKQTLEQPPEHPPYQPLELPPHQQPKSPPKPPQKPSPKPSPKQPTSPEMSSALRVLYKRSPSLQKRRLNASTAPPPAAVEPHAASLRGVGVSDGSNGTGRARGEGVAGGGGRKGGSVMEGTSAMPKKEQQSKQKQQLASLRCRRTAVEASANAADAASMPQTSPRPSRASPLHSKSSPLLKTAASKRVVSLSSRRQPKPAPEPVLKQATKWASKPGSKSASAPASKAASKAASKTARYAAHYAEPHKAPDMAWTSKAATKTASRTASRTASKASKAVPKPASKSTTKPSPALARPPPPPVEVPFDETFESTSSAHLPPTGPTGSAMPPAADPTPHGWASDMDQQRHDQAVAQFWQQQALAMEHFQMWQQWQQHLYWNSPYMQPMQAPPGDGREWGPQLSPPGRDWGPQPSPSRRQLAPVGNQMSPFGFPMPYGPPPPPKGMPPPQTQPSVAAAVDVAVAAAIDAAVAAAQPAMQPSTSQGMPSPPPQGMPTPPLQGMPPPPLQGMPSPPVKHMPPLQHLHPPPPWQLPAHLPMVQSTPTSS